MISLTSSAVFVLVILLSGIYFWCFGMNNLTQLVSFDNQSFLICPRDCYEELKVKSWDCKISVPTFKLLITHSHYFVTRLYHWILKIFPQFLVDVLIYIHHKLLILKHNCYTYLWTLDNPPAYL